MYLLHNPFLLKKKKSFLKLRCYENSITKSLNLHCCNGIFARRRMSHHFNTLIAGENCGASESCHDISPLKRLLPHSSSSLSHPFTLSGQDNDLHNLSVPLCSKMTSSNPSFTNRPYCSLIPDRLRAYSELRPLMDYSMLSPLHDKKIGGCRGQCLQSHCLLSIQNLQAGRSSGAQQDTATSSLMSPYGMYSYSLPFRPHLSSSPKSADSIILASSESLLCQTAWHSTVSHCL